MPDTNSHRKQLVSKNANEYNEHLVGSASLSARAAKSKNKNKKNIKWTSSVSKYNQKLKMLNT